MENTGDLNSVIQEKYDELRKEITRLQEKYDENGYDFSPMVKLQRIEQHVDYLISLLGKDRRDYYISNKRQGKTGEIPHVPVRFNLSLSFNQFLPISQKKFNEIFAQLVEDTEKINEELDKQ